MTEREDRCPAGGRQERSGPGQRRRPAIRAGGRCARCRHPARRTAASRSGAAWGCDHRPQRSGVSGSTPPARTPFPRPPTPADASSSSQRGLQLESRGRNAAPARARARHRPPGRLSGLGAASAEAELAAHWDSAYAQGGHAARSWFQDQPRASLQMLDGAGITPRDSLIDIGGRSFDARRCVARLRLEGPDRPSWTSLRSA